MTTFKEQMAEDLSSVFYNTEEFADQAVYVPANWQPGEPEDVSCSVIVDKDVLIQAEGYDIGMATMGTTITAMVNDIGTVNRGDTFTMETGQVYTVQRIERYSVDGHEVTVVVK